MSIGSESRVQSPPAALQTRPPLFAGGHLRTALRQFPADLRLPGMVLAALIGLLTAMGTLYYAGSAVSEAFNVNDEVYFVLDLHDFSPLPLHVSGLNVPVLFSGALLFAASLLAFGRASAGRVPAWAWLGLAGLFCFMGIDEIASIHERVPGWTGIDWELAYLPLALAGGLLWLGILRTLQASSLTGLLWIGCAAAWSLSQLLEFLEFHGSPDAISFTTVLILAEETAEMVGSALFVIAILVLAREASGTSISPTRPAAG